MPETTLSFRAIVLASERPGGGHLAKACRVAAGVLVPVAGKKALARVVEALTCCESVARVFLSGPAPAIIDESPELQYAVKQHAWIAPATGPAASSSGAMDQINDYPVLLTAGDHALLSAAIIDAFCDRAQELEFDVVVGLVPYRYVKQAYPQSRRTVLRFSDEPCCGSNLFAFLTPRGRRAVDFWQQVEKRRKRPWRIAALLGPLFLLRYLTGRCRLQEAIDTISNRAGCRLGFVLIDNPRAAIDVDSIADLALAEHILQSDNTNQA